MKQRGGGSGRLKMRGKKTHTCRAGCCVLENRREDYFTSLINKDLHMAKRTFG